MTSPITFPKHFEEDVLPVWFSELNYYMTKYECETLEELDDKLWFSYGIVLVVL